MSHDCWYCPVCDGYFDHGEECDCEQKDLPFVTVPDDYGAYPELFNEEDVSNE